MLPTEIYQRNLDLVADAFWVRDWPRMLRYMAPGLQELLDAASLLETNEQIIASCSAVRDSFERMRVTEYHRICLRAAFTAEDETAITGQHITHLFSGGTHALPPYRSEMDLILQDGTWKCHGIRAETLNRNLDAALRPAQLKD